jgi:hypothetical protein
MHRDPALIHQLQTLVIQIDEVVGNLALGAGLETEDARVERLPASGRERMIELANLRDVEGFLGRDPRIC